MRVSLPLTALLFMGVLALTINYASADEGPHPDRSAVPLAGCGAGTEYDPSCDVDQNGVINVQDMIFVGNHWNQSGTYTGDNAHNHLGQTWTGVDNPFIITGSFNGPAMTIHNDSGGNVGLRVTSTGDGIAVFGESPGTGVVGYANNAAGSGVYGRNLGGGYGVVGSSDHTETAGVWGDNWNDGYGVRGTSDSGIGIFGRGHDGVVGETNVAGRSGVYGYTNDEAGFGLFGRNVATNNTGFIGGFYDGMQAIAERLHGTGIQGVANDGSAAYGVWGRSTGGYAGYFSGKVEVTGNLTKGGGAFKIDHPLDPANKYLYHSFVESPDMKNIYDGVVMLDANGTATVEMPEWFEALNMEFRYQLTAIGAPGPDLYIAEELTGNRFSIAGGKPSMKVSWQVTGIRHDPYAEQHRIPVEETKSPEEQGRYLRPELYGKPDNLSVDYEKRQQSDASRLSAANMAPPHLPEHYVPGE